MNEVEHIVKYGNAKSIRVYMTTGITADVFADTVTADGEHVFFIREELIVGAFQKTMYSGYIILGRKSDD